MKKRKIDLIWVGAVVLEYNCGLTGGLMGHWTVTVTFGPAPSYHHGLEVH